GGTGRDEPPGVLRLPVGEERVEQRRPILEEPVEAGAGDAEPACQRLDLHRVEAGLDQRLPRRPEPDLARAAPAGRLLALVAGPVLRVHARSLPPRPTADKENEHY